MIDAVLIISPILSVKILSTKSDTRKIVIKNSMAIIKTITNDDPINSFSATLLLTFVKSLATLAKYPNSKNIAKKEIIANEKAYIPKLSIPISFAKSILEINPITKPNICAINRYIVCLAVTFFLSLVSKVISLNPPT